MGFLLQVQQKYKYRCAEKYDLVIGSDILFFEQYHLQLINTIDELLSKSIYINFKQMVEQLLWLQIDQIVF